VVSLSLGVLLAGVLLGTIAIGVFVWAWRAGHFLYLDEQSRVIFEPRDWRLERPWETEVQRSQRRRAHGRPLSPEPGEWGGAT